MGKIDLRVEQPTLTLRKHHQQELNHVRSIFARPHVLQLVDPTTERAYQSALIESWIVGFIRFWCSLLFHRDRTGWICISRYHTGG